jgi:autotransporter-associated beta strand protein
MRFRSRAVILTWTLALSASSAFAQTAIYKTDDSNDLGATSSWTLATGGSGGNPSSLDGSQIATFDNTVGASFASQTITTSTTFSGINVLNPGSTIGIGGTGTLTLGSSGITTATVVLAITAPLAVSASQTWNLGDGVNITSASFTGGAGIQITKTGSGTLEFESTSLTGGAGLTVDNGIVSLFGSPTLVPLTLNGGTLEYSASNNSPVSCSTTGLIETAVASTSYGGALSGAGTVTFRTTAAIGTDQWAANTSGFSGTLIFEASGNKTLIAFNGATASNLSSLTVDIEGANITSSGGTTLVSLGALMGSTSTSNITTGASLTVGALNTSTTFAGFIKSSGTFTKTGTGSLTLSNNGNIYTGATVINQGTLAVTGTLTATSSTTINSGGTLAGTGTISSSGTVTLNSGGTVAPGATLTLKNLTWAAGGTLLAATTNGVGSNLLSLGTGTLTKSGTGAFDVDFGGVTFSSPFTYTLITYGAESGYSSGDFTAVDATFGPNAIGAFSAGPTSLTYTISIVPEPSAFALLAGSLGLLAALRRRR